MVEHAATPTHADLPCDQPPEQSAETTATNISLAQRSSAAHSPDTMSRALREIESALRRRDAFLLGSRASRLSELMLRGEPEDGRMLLGGTACVTAFSDAQWSYVLGLDLCAILASQSCIETLLASAIESQGCRPAASYADLLLQAWEQKWLSDYEYRLFDRLRRQRNPYAHHRTINHRQNLDRRAMDTGGTPTALLQEDARAAVLALLDLSNRPPYALGPVVTSITEADLLPPVHPDQMSLLPASHETRATDM